jgi:hypothetical protein
MKMMQPLKISMLLLLFFCTSFKRADKIYRNTPLLTIQAKKWQVVTRYSGFFVNAIITNNSKDTFYYIIMPCMWESFYKVDSKDFYIKENNSCYKYGVKIIKIPPFQSVENQLEIYPLKPTFQLRSAKFRIGFNIQKPEKTSMLPINEYPENIIWSNTIDFN